MKKMKQDYYDDIDEENDYDEVIDDKKWNRTMTISLMKKWNEIIKMP